MQPQRVAKDPRHQDVALDHLGQPEDRADEQEREAQIGARLQQGDQEAERVARERPHERRKRREAAGHPQEDRVGRPDHEEPQREQHALQGADGQAAAEEGGQHGADAPGDARHALLLRSGHVPADDRVDPLQLEQQVPGVDRRQDDQREQSRGGAKEVPQGTRALGGEVSLTPGPELGPQLLCHEQQRRPLVAAPLERPEPREPPGLPMALEELPEPKVQGRQQPRLRVEDASRQVAPLRPDRDQGPRGEHRQDRVDRVHRALARPAAPLEP